MSIEYVQLRESRVFGKLHNLLDMLVSRPLSYSKRYISKDGAAGERAERVLRQARIRREARANVDRLLKTHNIG